MNSLKKVSLSLFFLLIVNALYSQSGKLEGTILDKSTKESLAGATLTILETGKEALTDFDGHFAFKELKPGVYTVKINYISYNPVIISHILIDSDKATIINTPLRKAEVAVPEEIEFIAAKSTIIGNDQLNVF